MHAHTPPKSSARIPFFTSSSWKIDGASARTCEHASSRRGRMDARTHARTHARTSRSWMSGDAASALNSSTRAAPIAAVSSVSSNVVWNSEPFAAERDSAEKRCLSHCVKPRRGVQPLQPLQPAVTGTLQPVKTRNVVRCTTRAARTSASGSRRRALHGTTAYCGYARRDVELVACCRPPAPAGSGSRRRTS